jgi:hypothetical protein
VTPKRLWRWTIEVDNPVQDRREQVVGPAGQHIADVDHEGARHRVGVHHVRMGFGTEILAGLAGISGGIEIAAD